MILFTFCYLIAKTFPIFIGTIDYHELLKSSSESDRQKIEELQQSISADFGCNIQFTSGTTGQPKATLLSHFGMVNTSYAIGETLPRR